MKPMKVMRYGSKYRYNRSKPKNTKKIVILTVIGVVAVIAAAITVWQLMIRSSADGSSALSLKMQEGNASQMELKTGDICMLTLPGSVDILDVAFASSDPDVVRVDSAGHTDALSEGTAVVTATAKGFSAACEFNVTPDPQPDQPEELTTAIKANEDILAANAENGTDDLYSLTVNRRTNTVTAYTYDVSGKYTVPVRAMVASCGTGGKDITVTGDFSIYFQEPWHPLYGDVYGMFVSGFEGPYLFHSVPYASQSHGDLETEEFNKLGKAASQGCVRMMASDVRWIFLNCSLNTPVHVIDADASADPLGKPKTVKVPADVRWDPTDTDPYNPYIGKMPELSGTDDVELNKGDAFDPMAGVSAVDICQNDITDHISLAGRVLSDKPGVYNLTYTLTDDFGQRVRVTRVVTVKE